MQELDIIAAIKFFGSVASTNGISDKAKEKANSYIERMIDSMSPGIDRLVAEASGIEIIK